MVSIFLDMGTKEAATQILNTWDELRSRKITADTARDRMASVRASMSERDYTLAKASAAAADSRR